MDSCDFPQLLSREEIAIRVAAVAQVLNREYAGRELTLVMVMKGALCLVADLVRQLEVPCVIEAVTARSYGERGVRPGELTLVGVEELCLEGKDVLVVDDIFDTGKTLATIVSELNKQAPRTLRSLVLLAKQIPRTSPFYPDYVLFEIPDQFVIGYGLDYKELYRNLPGIYIYQE